MAEDSFDAPSDFDQAGGGDDGTSIWMWVGIGCGAILLVAAAGLVFGGYKSYTCCRQAIEQQKEARKTASQFAVALRDGAYEQAWRLTTEEFRNETDLEAFRNRVEPYRDRIENSVPQLVGFRRHVGQQKKDGAAWRLEIGFMPHAGETYVVMSLNLRKRGSGEKMKFRVAEVSFERQERDVAAEPPARRIRRFNELVAEEAWERARGLTSSSFAAGESNDELKSYAKRHSSVLGADEIGFESIQYDPREGATVLAVHETKADGRVRVRYRVTKPALGWKIASIAFDVPAPDAAAPDGADAGTTDAGSAGDTAPETD